MLLHVSKVIRHLRFLYLKLSHQLLCLASMENQRAFTNQNTPNGNNKKKNNNKKWSFYLTFLMLSFFFFMKSL